MKKLDTYRSLCTKVYDLSKPSAQEEAYAFYRSYAKNAKGLILEPMCDLGIVKLVLKKFYTDLTADSVLLFEASIHHWKIQIDHDHN